MPSREAPGRKCRPVGTARWLPPAALPTPVHALNAAPPAAAEPRPPGDAAAATNHQPPSPRQSPQRQPNHHRQRDARHGVGHRVPTGPRREGQKFGSQVGWKSAVPNRSADCPPPVWTRGSSQSMLAMLQASAASSSTVNGRRFCKNAGRNFSALLLSCRRCPGVTVQNRRGGGRTGYPAPAP